MRSRVWLGQEGKPWAPSATQASQLAANVGSLVEFQSFPDGTAGRASSPLRRSENEPFRLGPKSLLRASQWPWKQAPRSPPNHRERFCCGAGAEAEMQRPVGAIEVEPIKGQVRDDPLGDAPHVFVFN